MDAESSPRIVIIDESPIGAVILEEGLREAGFTGVVHISEMQSLLARIHALDPDVIFRFGFIPVAMVIVFGKIGANKILA